MKFGLIFALLALLSPSLALAAVPEWQIDESASKLGFTAQMGAESFTGGFKKFNATIRFSPDDLANSSIAVTIAMSSAFAGAADRDAALPESPWFAVAQFPQAQFVSKSIEATEAGGYRANGTLTIRGISKDVQLPFTLTPENGKTRAQGRLTIQRNNFGVGQGEFASDAWVKFPVTISVDILAMPNVAKPNG